MRTWNATANAGRKITNARPVGARSRLDPAHRANTNASRKKGSESGRSDKRHRSGMSQRKTAVATAPVREKSSERRKETNTPPATATNSTFKTAASDPRAAIEGATFHRRANRTG